MSSVSRSFHAPLNPLSAIWRIYPSSKWSSQWPYDGYIRHGWMTSCGRGRDSATRECFGRGSPGTIFVRSSKLSLFFPESCPFRGVFFVSRAFVRFGAKLSISGAFGFDDVLEVFWKLRSVTGHFFANSDYMDYDHKYFFENFLSFFRNRADVTYLTAMAIPTLSKALWWWNIEDQNENLTSVRWRDGAQKDHGSSSRLARVVCGDPWSKREKTTRKSACDCAPAQPFII